MRNRKIIAYVVLVFFVLSILVSLMVIQKGSWAKKHEGIVKVAENTKSKRKTTKHHKKEHTTSIKSKKKNEQSTTQDKKSSKHEEDFVPERRLFQEEENIESTTEWELTFDERSVIKNKKSEKIIKKKMLKYKNCIFFAGRVIPFVRCKPTQGNVNAYDIVEDTNVFSTKYNKFFFGHNTRSFKYLYDVNVGNEIFLKEGRKICKYVVFRAEYAELNTDASDAFSCEDGISLVETCFGTETIRLFTCAKGYPSYYRWIIIAEKTYNED